MKDECNVHYKIRCNDYTDCDNGCPLHNLREICRTTDIQQFRDKTFAVDVSFSARYITDIELKNKRRKKKNA